ncbi:hypothetical protein EJD97_017331 [Solanum chilense]|uniref:Uncharacterized protein n=1 Tax=Solanum chilense TaxID=4083 RepID=A0A6N2CJ92_SOLCI|nr:hypothetical protein EJD97_017331 [Solanum chilense]
MTKYSPSTHKKTCNKGKGKVTFSIFVDSDSNDLFKSSISSSLAKLEIVLDPYYPISSKLGPKDLPFETQVIAHIVATTLFPRAGSHSMLIQCDTLFAYCLVSRRYNSHALLRMGLTLFGCSWDSRLIRTTWVLPLKYKDSFSTYVSTTKVNTTLENLVKMHNKLDIMAITISQVPDVMTKHFAMSEQVDSLKDLLLSSHFKIDSVKDVIKETGVDVARICLKLY